MKHGSQLTQLAFNLDLSRSSETHDPLKLALPATPRKIQLRETNKVDVTKIAASLDRIKSRATSIVSAILAARGLTPGEELDCFLNPPPLDALDASRFKNFDLAANQVTEAIRTRQRIAIVGDYDVDGITSLSLLLETLKQSSCPHDWWIPNRFIDGYGISARIAEEILKKNCKLVILLDHGSHSHQLVNLLAVKGIETIIFDHHIVGDSLPNGILVSPRQPGCGMSHEFPSASILSFLLCQRVSAQLNLNPPDPALAGLGAIVDMVPVLGINRAIAKPGLQKMRLGLNYGLRALAHQFKLLPADLLSSDLAFLLGPTLNACGRLEDGAQAVELLTSNNYNTAGDLAAKAIAINSRRKEIQRDEGLDNLIKLAESAALPRAIATYHETHHPGVNGLVAQLLATRYSRPAFVFADGNNGNLVGSARNGLELYDLSHILKVLKARDTREIIVKAGGHAAAAGLTIRKDRFNEFADLMGQVVAEIYPSIPTEVTIWADCALELKDISPDLIAKIDSVLEPYGNGFPAPQYLIEKLRVTDINSYGHGRFMVELEQNGRRCRSFIGPEIWNSDLRIGSIVTVVATPAAVYRNREKFVQLSIAAYQTHNEAPPAADYPDKSDFIDPQALSEVTLPEPPPLKHERSHKESKFALLTKQLRAAEAAFESSYIYPELAGRDSDPFNPTSKEQQALWWQELFDQCQFQMRVDGLEYRPAQVEFIRFFLDHQRSQVLQATTGTGKTIVCAAIASFYRSKGHPVIFLAPTIDIVKQQAARLSHLCQEQVTILDGHIDPDIRSQIYQTNPGIIVATPHVIKNDLEDKRFLPHSKTLLILDEIHHASGDYPYVPIIKRMREERCLILGVSATPAGSKSQASHEGSWAKLNKLKEIIGVKHIFPMNVPAHRPDVRCEVLQFSPSILKAEQHLAALVSIFQNQILDELYRRGLDPLIKEAAKLFGRSEVLFPSTYELTSLRTAIRELADNDRWLIYQKLLSIGEISELRTCLKEDGISAFLLRCVEKRFEISYPPRKKAGHRFLAPPGYLTAVYNSAEVRRAFQSLVPASMSDTWYPKLTDTTQTTWRALPQKERIKRFNKAVNSSKESIAETLSRTDYVDHPSETSVINSLMHEPIKTFLSVRSRELALFRARHLSYLLKDRSIKAVPLTGLGSGTRRGVSRNDRFKNLSLFNSGEAHILVGTSAADEGIDITASQGFSSNVGSHRRDKQQKGRVGRSSFGRFTHLCSSPKSYGKALNLIRKDIQFVNMLKNERSTIIQELQVESRALKQRLFDFE